ncbi:MAG: hypothetical protein ABFD86_19060, partial [Bryobacteraceae bacterium]
AMQIPKFRQTSAESSAAQAPTAATAPQQAPATAEPVIPAATAPAAQPPVVQQTESRTPQSPKTVLRRETVTREVPPPAAAQEPPRQAAPQQQAEPQRQAAEPANAAELREIREQLMLLGTRAGAAKNSLTNLQNQQARQGLGLRADIAGAAQRMEYYLDETEAALKRGDSAAAKKNLDMAERTVSKIESFLGH